MGYLFLAFAIMGELVGTTFLKYSEGFTKLAPSLISIASYILCFFLLSKSLKTINLSVAYATWCGIGIVATALISVFIFKEGVNLMSIIGIALVLIGVVILNLFGASH